MAEHSPFLPPRWFIRLAWRVHLGLFRLTGGRFGLRRPREQRFGLMHLTARGRRSGQHRSVMLAYYEDGPRIVTMAMNGWSDAVPAWWLNLQADPHADVRLPNRRARLVARAATDDEHERLWRRWIEIDGDIEAHARSRAVPTTVVVLESETMSDAMSGSDVAEHDAAGSTEHAADAE